MSTTEPHQALRHRCPFCHADPGQPCRTERGRGRELERFHTRRLAIDDAWLRRRTEGKQLQALCCECGQLRTVKSNYSFGDKDDNRSWDTLDHPQGWRVTGTLKCSECGARTRHALLRENNDYRDSAEHRQLVALGVDKPRDQYEDVDRLRAEYQAQLPRNPKLNHRYWISEAEKAWDAGARTVTAVCGDPMPLSKDPRTVDRSDDGSPYEAVQPDRIDWDTEFEDPETGLWWVDMDCVNCLRVANGRRIVRAQDRAKDLIDWYAKSIQHLNHDEVAALIEFLQPAATATSERWEQEKQRTQRPTDK